MCGIYLGPVLNALALRDIWGQLGNFEDNIMELFL